MTCGTRGCSQMGYYADQYNARGKMYLTTQVKEHGPFCGEFYQNNNNDNAKKNKRITMT